jgi:hypothetical protein
MQTASGGQRPSPKPLRLRSRPLNQNARLTRWLCVFAAELQSLEIAAAAAQGPLESSGGEVEGQDEGEGERRRRHGPAGCAAGPILGA